MAIAEAGPGSRSNRAGEVCAAFLRLGVTAFGGPVAHLGYFNAEFVERRKWLDQETYAQIVALCQFLPGPASSQVCIIIGLTRAGVLGGALAWLAFTLPSAIILTAFALGIAQIPGVANAAWLHGLLVAAVAVVAVAVSGMYRSLCPDVPRKSLALVAAAAITVVPASGIVQLGAIVAGALYGRFFISAAPGSTKPIPAIGNRTSAIAAGVAFLALLAGLPLIAPFTNGVVRAIAAFYESGALVFGGGHVVLPLLQARVVPPGWIGQDAFLAGYGAAQAVPGPLFTFAAYLGAAMHGPLTGIAGATVALLAIYLPSFLLLAAVLPFWNGIIRNPRVVAAVAGVNAAVVGILLAAFYQPVWVNAIHEPGDAALAVLAFAALAVWKWPPWLVVFTCAAVMQIVSVL